MTEKRTDAITRILVPVDFSVHSDKALQYAATLASRFGAQVELLHVVEDPFLAGAWSTEVAFIPNVPELLANLIDVAQGQLSEAKKRLARRGLVVESAVVTGQPARTILEHAKEGGFDLIVMGTHGRTGLSHAFIGSVAERVVQKAPCAVVTVREENPAAVPAATTAAA